MTKDWRVMFPFVQSNSMNEPSLLSMVIGWCYFLAWSVSFYPQVMLNWKRGSTHGLSTDFAFLNTIGFLCYSFYTNALGCSPYLSRQYTQRWGSPPDIPIQDLFFANHALLLSSITLYQTVVYSDTWSLQPWSRKFYQFAVFGGLLLLLESRLGVLSLLDVFYYLSGVKMCITLIKYIPQVALNYQNQSTLGWSMGNILLDLTGGVLSILQQGLDSYTSNDASIILGNPVKLGLGLISIFFDFIFIYQHYVLYPDSAIQDEDIETGTLNDPSQPLLKHVSEQPVESTTASILGTAFDNARERQTRPGL